MGISFQGTIKIKDGKIRNLSKGVDFVQINGERKSHHFGKAFAIPGFTDSHGHIASLGTKLKGLDLTDCQSVDDCLIKTTTNPYFRKYWIVGSGWNNELWQNKKMPSSKLLDKDYPDVPVFLLRIDGHAAWVNTHALKIAKIDKFTPNPLGGKIEKDKSGRPTGILLDNAIDLIKNIIPDFTDSQLKDNLKAAFEELVRYGITSVHDMDVSPKLLELFRELDFEHKIPLRIFSFISGHKNEWLKFKIYPESYHNLSIVGVKFYADGSLGSMSAAMLEDYDDYTGNKGIILTEESDLYQKVNKAIQTKFDVAVHAIGDSANRMVLKIYNKILKETHIHSNIKLRIEHAQHIHPDDLKYFDDTRIFASVQPVHCISDASTIAEKRLGDRCRYAYPWKSILDNGGKIISGSDFPIEHHNPLSGIEALTKRIPFGQTKPWHKKEILNIDTAVKSYTCYPPTAISSNKKLGDIKEGYLADLVVLDKDIFSCDNLSKVNVIATFVNGERVF